MSSFYSSNQTDFNAATGKSLQKTLRQIAIFFGEAIKTLASTLKHLIMSFLGK